MLINFKVAKYILAVPPGRIWIGYLQGNTCEMLSYFAALNWRSFCLAMLSIYLAACAAIPEQLSGDNLEKSASDDRTAMFSESGTIVGSLSLQEAVARAIKFNLDHKAKAMEQALALNQVNLDSYELLPTIAAKAGYSDRTEFSASNSKERGDGPPPTGGFSYSSDRTSHTGDLTVGWNILDFGVNYFNMRQNIDRSLIADERRKTVLNSLIREVEFSFWRMVAAQELKDRVTEAVKRAEKALADAEKVEEEKLRKPAETLRYQKRLLNNLRRLETVNQQLSTAKVELAALINVPPTTEFKLTPAIGHGLAIPKWKMDIGEMEIMAFRNNPGIREKLYLKRITIQEAKKSLINLLPGIDLSGGKNYDLNSFLDENRWYQWSATLSLNVFKLLSIPDQIQYNEANAAVTKAQRLALRMAVLAQVHVANIQYINAAKQFERAEKLYLIDKRLSEQISKRQESDMQSMLDRISQETAAIDSLLRRYQTYADLVAAYGRIQSTLGIGILNEGKYPRDLKNLSRSIGLALKRRANYEEYLANLKSSGTQKSWKKQLDKIMRTNKVMAELGPSDSTPSSTLENRSVVVSLNEGPGIGKIEKANVICGSISKTKSYGGWMRLSALSNSNAAVKGWIHGIHILRTQDKCRQDFPTLKPNEFLVVNPDTNPPKPRSRQRSITISLNKKPNSTLAHRQKLLCSSISKHDSKRGWTKIIGENLDDFYVEGWTKNLFGSKLDIQCGHNVDSVKPKNLLDHKPKIEKRNNPRQLGKTMQLSLSGKPTPEPKKRYEVLCDSIVKNFPVSGWVKITALNLDKILISGWIQKIYADKIKYQCSNEIPA